MVIKARLLRVLLRELLANGTDLHEGNVLEAVRGLAGWPSDIGPEEESQAIEALRALRSLHTEQVPATTVHAVATARTLHGIASIEGALARIFDGCQSDLLLLSLTWSTEITSLIEQVAGRGCSITLVGNEEDAAFRSAVAFWKTPGNPPTALVARESRLMHVKAAVADRRRGYLGSGNLTSGGTKNNMELGVAFEGDLGDQIWSFVESQQRAGYLVEYRTG